MAEPQVPSITRAGHLEFRVTDMERARHFYVEVLGFVEAERTKDALYLGGYEERDLYSLALRKADSPGVSHVSFRVAKPDDLDLIERLYKEAGRPTRRLAAGAERGQGPALRVQDGSGLPIEFYHQIARREWLIQRFDLHRGARVLRLDHFNCQVTDVQAAYDWFTQRLGFTCSEYTVTEDEPPRIWAAWLHRKQGVHDLALMAGTGPRLHHAGFWVGDQASILRACDILAAAGYAESIERGPGRHGISNAFFLYLRDPDGNRLELYTNEYQISDPDWDPVRWTLNDPRRQTFWGHKAPPSWFDEASPVESIETGELMPVGKATLKDRPEFIT